MKNITKALQETEYKPRAKWWGFVKDGRRYLCRYNHVFFVCDRNEILYVDYETRTDKVGVEFAIKYYNENQSKMNFENNIGNETLFIYYILSA